MCNSPPSTDLHAFATCHISPRSAHLSLPHPSPLSLSSLVGLRSSCSTVASVSGSPVAVAAAFRCANHFKKRTNPPFSRQISVVIPTFFNSAVLCYIALGIEDKVDDEVGGLGTCVLAAAQLGGLDGTSAGAVDV